MTVLPTTTYLITGANRGLGLGLVEAYLARAQTTVIAAVRNPAPSANKSLHDLPKGPNSRLIIVKIDSASPFDADEAISTLQRGHGITTLDVVIANAGIANAFPQVHEAQPRELLDHFSINVVGVVALFRAVRPLLLETALQGKRAVFMSMSTNAGSISGQDQVPVPNSVYGPSKAALNWITMKAHLENRDLGLCVFAMHPGWVQTDMGNAGARLFSLEKANIMVEESITGMVDVLDKATIESTAGKFKVYDGRELPW